MSAHIPLTHLSLKIVLVAIQFLSHIWLFATLWTATPRLPCPPLSFGVCSSSCPLSWQCYLTISSSAAVLSFCLQSFPASGSFPVFTSGGQSIGSSASVLPMNIQGWFPLGLTDLVSLLSKGLSRVSSSTAVWKASILGCSAFFMVQLSHLHMPTGKTTALTLGL